MNEKNKDLVVTFFQAFWDSEVPRFGEAGAKGWATWQREAESTVRDAIELVQDYDPSAATVEDDLEREAQMQELQRMVQANEQTLARTAASNEKSSKLAAKHGAVDHRSNLMDSDSDDDDNEDDTANDDTARHRSDEAAGQSSDNAGAATLASVKAEEPQSAMEVDEPDEFLQRIDALAQWLREEDANDLNMWMPLHASADVDVDDEDPERMVLFDGSSASRLALMRRKS